MNLPRYWKFPASLRHFLLVEGLALAGIFATFVALSLGLRPRHFVLIEGLALAGIFATFAALSLGSRLRHFLLIARLALAGIFTTFAALSLGSRLRHFLLIEGLALAGIFATFVALSLGPRALGYSAFVVYGGSMEPAIARGSVAVGRPVGIDSLREGDVIAYRSGPGLPPTLHRIVEVREEAGKKLIATKGDANPTQDPAEMELEGRGSKIIYSLPYIGYVLHGPRILLDGNLWFTLSVLGLGAIALWTIWRESPASEKSGRPAASATGNDRGRLGLFPAQAERRRQLRERLDVIQRPRFRQGAA